MGRVTRNTKIVAFQQQRHRAACADAQSDQRLCCSSLSCISKSAKSTLTKTCGDICQSNMLKKNVKIELSEKVSLHKEYLY